MLALALLFAGQAVISALGRFLLERLGEGIVLGLRRRLVRHVLGVRMTDLERQRTGDLVARATSDATDLRDVASQSLVDLVAGGVTVVATVALMLWLDPVLLALIALTMALAGAAVACLLARIRAAGERAQAGSARWPPISSGPSAPSAPSARAGRRSARPSA